MILEHDTEPDVDVAIVNSYVTVAARNWCIVPIVVEATTTKDGPTLVLVYPNLIYKSKLFISFDFCFYFLVFLLFSSLYPHVLYSRLTGVSASIGCKARHGTQCRRRMSRSQYCCRDGKKLGSQTRRQRSYHHEGRRSSLRL